MFRRGSTGGNDNREGYFASLRDWGEGKVR
jgi:hypothetical protein